jgi:hypothetical protein
VGEQLKIVAQQMEDIVEQNGVLKKELEKNGKD